MTKHFGRNLFCGIGFSLIAAVPVFASPTFLGRGITGGSAITVSGGFENGFDFTTSQTIVIDEIGVDANLSGVIPVGIWNSAQTALFTGTVDTSTATADEEMLFSAIAPVTLGPGTYDIGLFESGGMQFTQNGAADPGPGITINFDNYGFGEGDPTSTQGGNFGDNTVDFMFSTLSAPEIDAEGSFTAPLVVAFGCLLLLGDCRKRSA